MLEIDRDGVGLLRGGTDETKALDQERARRTGSMANPAINYQVATNGGTCKTLTGTLRSSTGWLQSGENNRSNPSPIYTHVPLGP